jgi:hypothetical protein
MTKILLPLRSQIVSVATRRQLPQYAAKILRLKYKTAIFQRFRVHQ